MGKTYKDAKFRKKGGLMSSKVHKDKRMKSHRRDGKCDCKCKHEENGD